MNKLLNKAMDRAAAKYLAAFRDALAELSGPSGITALSVPVYADTFNWLRVQLLCQGKECAEELGLT